MTSSSRVAPPPTFLWLVGAVLVVRAILSLLSAGPGLVQLALLLLILALAASTLVGKAGSAKALGYLLSVLGGLQLLSLLVPLGPWWYVGAFAAWGILAIYTGRYVLKNPALREYLASQRSQGAGSSAA